MKRSRSQYLEQLKALLAGRCVACEQPLPPPKRPGVRGPQILCGAAECLRVRNRLYEADTRVRPPRPPTPGIARTLRKATCGRCGAVFEHDRVNRPAGCIEGPCAIAHRKALAQASRARRKEAYRKWREENGGRL